MVLPRDTHVLDPAEIVRLSRQSLAVLARLERGPATNVELAAIALKYTSRISDLRKAGYEVEPIARHGGLVTYGLVRQGETAQLF